VNLSGSFVHDRVAQRICEPCGIGHRFQIFEVLEGVGDRELVRLMVAFQGPSDEGTVKRAIHAAVSYDGIEA
jgi:hypothetical protein